MAPAAAAAAASARGNNVDDTELMCIEYFEFVTLRKERAGRKID